MLALLISLSLSLEIVASNLKVASKALGCSSIDGKGVATFEVTSPETQTCDLSFLIMPGEYEDGSFTSVTLKVNGTTLSSPITFNTYGWQSANTTGNAVTLNKGENTIQFISGRDDVPLVSNVKNYIEYKPFSLKESAAQNKITTISESSSVLMSDSIYYGFYRNHPHFYTTYIPLSFSEKTSLTLYAPTANDPMFGPYESKVEYTAYIFNTDFSYSESVSTNNKYIHWQDSIPAGNYYVLLEANNEFGYASLRINSTLYKYSYVSSVNIDVSFIKEAYSVIGGYYNIFTTNTWVGSESMNQEADPILWLKKYRDNGPPIIVAYNDNNNTLSDFYWGKNARIRYYVSGGQYYFPPRHTIFFSSANPGTFSNVEWCDVYHSKLRGESETSWNIAGFPMLKHEDAIVSAIRNSNIERYNCISWSAGITYENLWPSNSVGNNNILWFDSLYNNQPVHSRTETFQRPSSMQRYTRSGNDSVNAVVALWGIIEPNGDTTFTHASIRNNIYDGIPHGYDWESKLGLGVRLFHPCHALRGNDSLPGYGQIVAYYRPIDENSTYSFRTIQEQVAEEDIIVETDLLTDTDLEIINNITINIPSIQKSNFETLYNNWKLCVEQYKNKANLWSHKEYSQYTALLTCMQNIENGEFGI
ncbi:MAG: hypothetical protein IKU59_06965 [Bacteroidales bacterium]|nr:hypothetical protein [Bacteroidales bacterium]